MIRRPPISTQGRSSAASDVYKRQFLPTVGALADRHRVIALDLPGFGDSDKPFAAGYNAPFFARSVVALMDALDLPSASLIGNSMGGRVALELSLIHISEPTRPY